MHPPVPRRLPCLDDQRGAPVELGGSGARVQAFAGESVAAALFAGGERVLGRSLKYHRPRSFFCLDGHCSGCLVRIGGVPNLRACQIACAPGLEVDAQNAYPSADLDLLGAVDFMFPRGMDHHSLMTGSKVLNLVANKVVRQLSGLGTLPARTAEPAPPAELVDADVIVVGAGPAGLAAATAAAAAGARVVLVDEQPRPGGSLRVDPRTGPAEVERRVAAAVAAGATLRSSHTVVGWFPEQGERGVAIAASPSALTRLTARAWVWATGSYAVNVPVPDNDRPGVFAARAVGRLLVDHAILAGDRICMIEEPAMADDAAALAGALAAAGATVERVAAAEVTAVRGRGWVKAVVAGGRKIACDAVAVAAVPSPASEGPRQHGCEVVLDPARGGFAVIADERGATRVPGVFACGDVCGYAGIAAATAAGARAGEAATAYLRGGTS